MRDLMNVTRALADENRVRILMFLHHGGELCACEVIDLLGLAGSTVSKHLSILHHAKLVAARKDGRWHYFKLIAADAGPEVKGALAWLTESLADNPQIRADRKALAKRLKRRNAPGCDPKD